MREIAIESLTETLAADKNIIAAWLFGSAKGGSVRRGADLDVGVFFDSRPGLDELATLRANLQQALRFDEIDLVLLNDSAAILRFEAASGRLVCSRDDARRAEFVSLAAREYEDEMAMIQRSLNADRD